jgi:hypothetical protein
MARPRKPGPIDVFPRYDPVTGVCTHDCLGQLIPSLNVHLKRRIALCTQEIARERCGNRECDNDATTSFQLRAKGKSLPLCDGCLNKAIGAAPEVKKQPSRSFLN